MRYGTILGISLMAVLTLGVVSCGGSDEPEATATVAPAATATSVPADNGGGSEGGVVNILSLENPYVFEPDTLDFEVGKTYTLNFVAPDEFHTFTVAELDIDVLLLAGQAVEQTVTFDKAGTFTLICLPHEALGMVGTVTVS